MTTMPIEINKDFILSIIRQSKRGRPKTLENHNVLELDKRLRKLCKEYRKNYMIYNINILLKEKRKINKATWSRYKKEGKMPTAIYNNIEEFVKNHGY